MIKIILHYGLLYTDIKVSHAYINSEFEQRISTWVVGKNRGISSMQCFVVDRFTRGRKEPSDNVGRRFSKVAAGELAFH